MIQLSRRELLAGTAATTAALSLGMPSQLRAAAPATGKQAPGVYRYKVGDFEVTQIADGARTFPMPDTFVVNQKKEEALAAAEAAYMPKGHVTIPFNPMVINTGSKLVVIDTGNGLGAFEQSKGAVGQMNANMLAAGLDPKAVDIVLISHFHGDHMNGLKKADGSPVYPNAEIKVPAVEWAFWADESNASKANGFNKPNFPNVKKAFDGIAVTKFEWDKEVAPGITAIGTATGKAMTGVTRRAALLGGASIALAPTILPAQAATPMAGKQAPGFYRYKVGDHECTSLSDGANVFPLPDTFVRNVAKDQA